jgi:hypothetical protein
VTTVELSDACEPAIDHAGLTGSRASSHHYTVKPPSCVDRISRHFCTSHTRSSADPLDIPALHAFVPSRPQSIRTDSTVWDLNRDFKEEHLPSLEGAADENENEEEHAGSGPVYSDLIANSKPRSTASSVSTTTKPVKPVTAPQIHHSLNDSKPSPENYA